MGAARSRGAVDQTGTRMNGSGSNHLQHAFGKIKYHHTLGFLKQDYRDGLTYEAPFYSGYELAAVYLANPKYQC